MWNQRGAGKLGLLVWFAVMGSAVFAAFRCVPPKLAVMQFHDYIDEQLKFCAVSPRCDQGKMMKNIFQKAAEFDLPVDKKAATLDVRQTEMILKLKHQVVVNLEVYQWVWDYDKTFRHIRM